MGTKEKVLYWLPRLLCIGAILFVSMFALDAFQPGMPILEQIGGFLIHMIPSFVLLVVLLVAWKWELVGGVVITLIGLGFSPFVYLMNYNRTHSVGISLSIILMINLPFVIVGVLFILNHYRNKKNGTVNW
jgi:hypothetical protein